MYLNELVTSHFPAAEASLQEDYHAEQPEGKRYAVDPGDSAFGAISSSYSPNPRTASDRLSVCFAAGAYSAPSQSPERRVLSREPSSWSVEDVVWFIRDADPQALGPHAELFRKHEIDGNALLLLKSDMIMKYLGLKLGPALKLCYHIDKLKQNKF
uniref:SAM domain-containing protein n=1 Tax=Neogobius melanostomus TaxID=47308 RepID=A0A8C6TJ56_9GOBI